MSETSKKIHTNLNRDFLFYLSFVPSYYSQLTEERDQVLSMKWLRKLIEEKVHGVAEKRNRNIYLSHLIMHMQEGELKGPFQNSPEDGPLSKANIVFKLIQEDERFIEESNQEDVQEISKDGRTYVAIRFLPNNQGMYAYVSLNLDKPREDFTIDSCLGLNPTESEMENFYIKNIESKISGDIGELYKSLHVPNGNTCGKSKHEMAYYDYILKEIDRVIRGVGSTENKVIKFLITRLSQDLKQEPKMKDLFKLSPEQQNLKLLEILRQKLVVRQQDNKRLDILAEMGEREFVRSCCSITLGFPNAEKSSDLGWELAMTKSLNDTDMRQLNQAYPEIVNSFFNDLLAEDRKIILDKGKRRQNKWIKSMRSEVYKEVQSGKAEYNKSRTAFREWNEILSTVEELMYEARSEIVDTDQPSHGKEQILSNMISSIKEMECLVTDEARRGETFTEKIVDANMWTFPTVDDFSKDISWKVKSSTETMRKEIEIYKKLIEKQKERIEYLKGEL